MAGQNEYLQWQNSPGEIQSVTFSDLDGDQFYGVGQECHMDPPRTVTEIKKITKPGEHALIPYLQVWADDLLLAEFSQHSLSGVFFRNPKP